MKMTPLYKRFVLLVLVILRSAPASAGEGPQSHPEIWNPQPIFADEFDGPSLDGALWGTRYPGSDEDYGDRSSFDFVGDGTKGNPKSIRLLLTPGQSSGSGSHIGTGNDGLDVLG